MEVTLPVLVLLVAALVWTAAPATAQGGGGGKPGGGGGRLSPASLDLDTCGCPTTFGDPACEKRTSWTLDKTTLSGPFTNPENEAFIFNVTVTEGPTTTYLTATGEIRISNSGAQTPTLASVAVLLEDLYEGGGDAPGPSGQNWLVLGAVAENEAPACGATATICGGDDFAQSDGSNLVLYNCEDFNDIIALSDGVEIPPATDDDGDGRTGEDPALSNTIAAGSNCFGILDNDGDGLLDEDPGFGAEAGIDNDGDGLTDEDPVDGIDNDLDGLIDEDDPDDDGDGLVDEDGPDDDRDGLIDEDDDCADVVEFCFDATFDIDGLGIEGPGDGAVPSDDDLRIDLLVTFKGGGKRGGTCSLDVDCDGSVEDGKGGSADEGEGHVRTVQQRHRFDPVECDELCQTVALSDPGAAAQDDCVDVFPTLNDADGQFIEAVYEGTVSEYTVEGEVSCRNCEEVADLAGLEAALDPYNPGGGTEGTANITVAYPGGDSYFNSTVSNGGDFNGTYDGWCIDTNTTISPGTTYCTEMVSTYDPVSDNFVNVPYLGTGERTLDLVNFIINQDYTTQAATCVARNYTFGDIQRAIWDLVNPTSTSGLGTWSQCAADEIRNAAVADHAANGAFVPACGQQVAIVFNPCGNTGPNPSPGYQITIYQITVGSAAVPCGTVCSDCDTVVTNTAELTCEDDPSLVEGSPASASFAVTCEGGEPPGPGIDPGDFCSQTQGGWGQDDNCDGSGNNPGKLRCQYFDDVFGSGLVVGDADGPDADTLYAILLTGSEAVAEYLPAGGTPAALTADQTNPETTSSGVFGGQLTAATLNVAFDAEGLGLCTLTGSCTFPNPPGTLGTLVYGDCVAESLRGLSVNEVLALANTAISGGGLPVDVSFGDLSDALAALNEEFVDCDTVATGCLTLP